MCEAVICTIISKNYLAHARALTQTFLRYHPQGRVFVLLVDEIDGYFDPAEESFTVVPVSQIGIPNLQAMIFRYTILELNTAVKPYFLDYLFKRYGLEKLCYFDPDITFHHSLDEIFDLLTGRLMVLVPHLLDFLEDGYLPDEPYIMRSGIYNLGFIGLARHPELERFLSWWQRRLERWCMVDTARGLFTDQRWIDLAPGLFEGVYIHRDPGCDIAYWNLNHRRVEPVGNGYLVNGSPLKFFHYSGFMVEDAEIISKHQNRYTLTDVPHLRLLYEDYRRLLIEQGYFTVKDWPYAYSQFYFDNGMPAPEIIRLIWRAVDEICPDRWPDPLAVAVPDSFLTWLNQPADTPPPGQPVITNLALAIYNQRPDLQRVFPEMLQHQRQTYAQWFVGAAGRDHNLDEDTFIRPMAEALAATYQSQMAVLQAEMAAAREQLAAVQAALQAREHELAAIHGSRAWKIVRRIQQAYRLIK